MVEVDQSHIQAYVKLLHPREVFNEALGSVMCQLVGLPTPPSYLVLVERTDYPQSPIFGQLGEPHVLAFGTHAMPMQTMARHVSLSTPPAIRALISKWAEWPDALVFDQWIANPDRHLRNLLIGGPGEVYLIDHGLSFLGSTSTPEQLRSAVTLVTIRLWREFLDAHVSLAERVVGAAQANRAGAHFLTIDPAMAISATGIQRLLSADHIEALTAFLVQRRASAPSVICNAMGVHNLPF